MITKIKKKIRSIINISFVFLTKITRTELSFIENNQPKKENNFGLREYKRLAEKYKEYDELKLHFGCGGRILKEWINIDLFYGSFKKYLKYYSNNTYPEGEEERGTQKDFFAFNILKTGLPFENETVDVIFHEDFIEHLNQKEQVLFLAETLRVLKYGSIHRINTPNLLTSMKNNSDFKNGLSGVFTDEWDKHIHKNILTPEYLKEIATMIGYSNVVFSNRDGSLSKKIPKEYRPTADSRSLDGNIFVDLIK